MVSPAREAAFKILNEVESTRAHAEDLLRGKRISALAQADRNLATALVLGVLRWQIWLDEQIRPLLKRPGAKLDAEVRVALRLGAFQLQFLDRVPAHAAINQSVELAKRAGHRFAAGMVNAVLRKIAAGRTAKLGPVRQMADDSAVTSAHPAWMVERWARAYGVDAARAICVCGQSQPSATARLADGAVEMELAGAGVKMTPGNLLSAARKVIAGDIAATAAFRAGTIRLQDEGSQLIGEIAAGAGAMGVRQPQRLIDLCAAPGGKTLILAERNPQARILACEASEMRLAALRERLAPLGEQVECRLADATALDEEAAFDAALADVPCSGTGTLGRNPEIRHRLHEEEIARQAERQKAILRATLRIVRPGGWIVYSTCSLEPEENELVVGAVVAENPGVRVVPMERCIFALESRGVLVAGAAERLRNCITPDGTMRLMPGQFETDGFFVALLQRSV